MTIEVLNWALRQRGLYPECKLLLIGLASQADPTDVARVSVQRLADFIERAPSTTQRYLRTLERAHLIVRLPAGWQLRRPK